MNAERELEARPSTIGLGIIGSQIMSFKMVLVSDYAL